MPQRFRWPNLECFALGELNLSRKEFNEMSWEDYCYKSHGYFIRQAREREPLRIIATILFNANVDKNNRTTPDKIMPLFTDTFNTISESAGDKSKNLEERRARARKHAEIINERERDKLNNGSSN